MKKLAGKRVAFTGRLACMTRAEAADLVRKQGGIFAGKVNGKTSLLIVGQEGWPLKKDGNLADPLEAARNLQALGHDLAILTEEAFLHDLGMDGENGGVHKQFSLPQLCRLLKIPRDRLRFWTRAGWLEPVSNDDGVAFFDFHQVTAIRSLWTLAQAGVTPDKMRRSLEKLSRWMPQQALSLKHLQLLEKDGTLLVRLEEGQLVDTTGQLYFDFAPEETSMPLDATPGISAWERGCALEQAGHHKEAMQAYEEALQAGGPEASLCLNLGNIHFSQGNFDGALTRFRQAVDCEPGFYEAWNNLGITHMAQARHVEAEAAFRKALRVQPAYADAHYNLAEALEEAGRFSEARKHWKEYLRLEPIGQWANYARSRLANRDVV